MREIPFSVDPTGQVVDPECGDGELVRVEFGVHDAVLTIKRESAINEESGINDIIINMMRCKYICLESDLMQNVISYLRIVSFSDLSQLEVDLLNPIFKNAFAYFESSVNFHPSEDDLVLIVGGIAGVDGIMVSSSVSFFELA